MSSRKTLTMKILLPIIALGLTPCFGSLNANRSAFAFRSSPDYTQQIVYLTPVLALTKQLGKKNDFGGSDLGEERFWYEFVEASEGPPSDYASSTGDVIHKILIKNPLRFVIRDKYIIGESSQYDWQKKMPAKVPFAIMLDTNEVVLGERADRLFREIENAPDRSLDPAFIEIHAAFDKYVIEFLSQKSGKQ
jgi:hypothetical protein